MISEARTAVVCPAWLQSGRRGSCYYHSPEEGRVFFMDDAERQTTYVFTAPSALPQTMDEARAAVAEYRVR